MTKQADKPDSVHAPAETGARGNHSSRRAIADALELPTRRRTGAPSCIRGCAPAYLELLSGWRLPCRSVSRRPRCALTAPFHPYLISGLAPEAIGGLLSVALFRVSSRMAVSHHPALWSPDFPRPLRSKPSRPRLPGLLCGIDFNIGGKGNSAHSLRRGFLCGGRCVSSAKARLAGAAAGAENCGVIVKIGGCVRAPPARHAEHWQRRERAAIGRFGQYARRNPFVKHRAAGGVIARKIVDGNVHDQRVRRKCAPRSACSMRRAHR